MNRPSVTPAIFDAIAGRKSAPPIIWTAEAIGLRIGRSADYVRRTLAKMEGSPVHRRGRGNYYAFEAELLDFWKQHAA